jgi:hypothetical protein
MSGAIPLLLLNVFMVWTETTLPFCNNFTGRLLGGILSHSGLATTGIEPQSSDFFTGSQLVTKSIAAHKGDLSWSSSWHFLAVFSQYQLFRSYSVAVCASLWQMTSSLQRIQSLVTNDISSNI